MSGPLRAVSVAEALAIIRDSVPPLARTERVPLAAAGGRVLAGDIVSTVDVPPFDRAAMDGYAVVASDTDTAAADAPVALECLEQVLAGDRGERVVRERTCAAVATGAPMPEGADAVVMIERARRDGTRIQVLEPVKQGEHVGRRGADIAVGAAVARPGALLSPGLVGALAAVGTSSVEVYARPLVRVVSTGPELVSPGQALGPGRIYDVNGHALIALVADHGGTSLLDHTRGDCRDELVRALDDGRGADLIVLSGATSVGTHDLIVEAMACRGTVWFHRVAVKPGKSTAFGCVDGVPVLALPGYPAACLLNAYVLLVPLLSQLARLPEQRRHVSAPLSRRATSPRDRHHFLPVRLERGLAVPAFKKAGDVTSVSLADGYVAVEPGIDAVDAGTIVDVTLF